MVCGVNTYFVQCPYNRVTIEHVFNTEVCCAANGCCIAQTYRVSGAPIAGFPPFDSAYVLPINILIYENEAFKRGSGIGLWFPWQNHDPNRKQLGVYIGRR
jgi:hypothetical protein